MDIYDMCPDADPYGNDAPAGTTLVVDEEPEKLTNDQALDIIGRINAHKRRILEIQYNAGALKRQLNHRIERILYVHGSALQEWARGVVRHGRKSKRTLEGVVGWESVPVKVTVTAPEQLLAWVDEECRRIQADINAREKSHGVDEECFRLLRTKTQMELLIERRVNAKLIDPEAFRVVDEATGVVGYAPPPGLHIEAGTERFYVRPGATKPTTEGDDDDA